jgi:prophage tail gpP-like protein
MTTLEAAEIARDAMAPYCRTVSLLPISEGYLVVGRQQGTARTESLCIGVTSPSREHVDQAIAQMRADVEANPL